MKTNIFFKHLCYASIVILLLTSCVTNYQMITTVNKDGSFQRVIFTKADTAFMAGNMNRNPYLFDVDSNWIFTDLKIDSSENKMMGITRNFKSFEEYSEKLQFKEEFKPLANPKETLSKKFKWFYTYYSFKAVYGRIFEDLPIPLGKYMTEAEQNSWFQGDFKQLSGWNGYEMAGELEETGQKFWKWYYHNVFEIYFNAVYQSVKQHDFIFTSQMSEIKDSIFQLSWEKSKKEEDFGIANFVVYDVIIMLDNFFETSEFSAFYDANDDEIEKYANSFSTDIFGKLINYELILPGKIIQTNAPIISGDNLKWKADAIRMLPSDYILTAQSRTANIWAFIVTALLVLFSGFCLIFKK